MSPFDQTAATAPTIVEFALLEVEPLPAPLPPAIGKAAIAFQAIVSGDTLSQTTARPPDQRSVSSGDVFFHRSDLPSVGSGTVAHIGGRTWTPAAVDALFGNEKLDTLRDAADELAISVVQAGKEARPWLNSRRNSLRICLICSLSPLNGRTNCKRVGDFIAKTGRPS